MVLDVKDSQITINGLVSFCKCRCKHCLLCSGDGIIQPVPFEQLKQLALKFKGFHERTGIDTSLCVYNCADYPELPQAMEADRTISRHSGYQNLNGTPIREGKELSDWATYLKNVCGVTNANLSWFGTRAFHDEFAQRKGYFDYLINVAKELQRQKITSHNTVFILKSNLNQLENLYEELKTLGGSTTFCLLDYRGNAKNVADEYLRPDDMPAMPKMLFESGLYNQKRNKLESEWVDEVLSKNEPSLSKRMMFLVATPDNIDTYLKMSCDEILKMFHEIDEKLQKTIPSIEYLAKTYGNRDDILLDFRSLLWKWIDMFFEDNPELDKTLLFSDLHTSVMWR